MTDKQKQAISAVNDAKQNGTLDDEKYYLLLEFIMGNQPITQYIPWHIPWLIEIPKPNPISALWITYCGDSSGSKPI